MYCLTLNHRQFGLIRMRCQITCVAFGPKLFDTRNNLFIKNWGNVLKILVEVETTNIAYVQNLPRSGGVN